MKLCLSQSFPLGRFHATPWKTFPYDDPFGEWPPSPWRLLRGLLSRSHQWERETGGVDDQARTVLVSAFAESTLSWNLPSFSWGGPGLRQYHPAEFKKVPAAAKEPGMYTYNTTKVQDNFWLTGGEAQPLYWIFECEGWEASTLNLLDACLARMTYFGRAESITKLQRVEPEGIPEPNCTLEDVRGEESVPVLCPRLDVSLEQLQLTTDDTAVRNSTVPPGAIWRFARRPQRPATRPRPRQTVQERKPVSFMQFALGSRVAPGLDHVALIANWFRGRVVKTYLDRQFYIEKGVWKAATPEQRQAVALLAGKSPDGTKLTGHRHAYFGLYFDPETQTPSRLLAWRDEPFSGAEQEAIAEAASRPFSLGFRERVAVDQDTTARDPWKVHCVPLDSAVLPPPGFDTSNSFPEWISLTPYVPPRHAFDKRGKARIGQRPIEQLQEDLARMGLPEAKVELLDDSETGRWVKVHESNRKREGPSNVSKRGFRFRLTFLEPVSGPLALGRSSHYGLGLFVPAGSAVNA